MLAVLLAACSSIPTPKDCRRHGVNVTDGDPVTGKVVGEHYESLEVVQAKCYGNSGCVCAPGFVNCVFITARGEYEIWFSDGSLIPHEQCHAYYEETRHM